MFGPPLNPMGTPKDEAELMSNVTAEDKPATPHCLQGGRRGAEPTAVHSSDLPSRGHGVVSTPRIPEETANSFGHTANAGQPSDCWLGPGLDSSYSWLPVPELDGVYGKASW